MRLAAPASLPDRRTEGRETARRLASPAALMLAMAALLVLAPPAGEFPIDIDWNYARVVQTLLEQGRLQISPWTASSLVLQVYWGALFAHLLGFSHTALRVSTLVLAAAGVIGFYLLLRALLDRQRALLGALLLLFNPAFVCLSYSFKTNVPFLSLSVWSLACYVWSLRGRAVDRDPAGTPRARPYPNLGWLAAGSALAGGAFLVRQLGAGLPLAALGGLLLVGGWQETLRPRYFVAVLGPFVPAVLLGAYFDSQRDSVRQQPVSWMLDFWMEHGPGMIGIVLARLAETFATLGLFTLPVSIGALAGRPALRLDRRQRWLAGVLLAALVVGFIVRGEMLRLTPLFPFRNDPLSPRGFYVDDKFYGGTLPDSILIPDGVLAILTLGALLGGGLLAVAAVVVLSRETIRGPASMPLLFGLITLGPTVVYYKFWGDYVLAFLPSALLATLLAFGGRRGSAAGDRRGPLTPRAQWSPAPVLVGVALLAAWSVWWERDFLARQAALWQAGRALIEQGVPPEEVDGGFEWNGWYRGQAAIAAVVERSKGGRVGREMQGHILGAMKVRNARWGLAFAPPVDAPGRRVLAVVPYGPGSPVVAVQGP